MKKGKESPNFIDRTGEMVFNKKGHKAKIIKYNSALDIDIEFEDGTICKNLIYSNFIKGSFSNKNAPVYYNVGFQGIGKYTFVDNKKIGDVWVRMLQRCYDEKLLQKQPSYREYTVCKEWHNFQNFAKWFENNYIKGFHLDRDILCKECKTYSPETCGFVPVEINALFTKRQNCRGDLPIGVGKRKASNKYTASFTKNGKGIFLGYFDTPEEAFQAYKIAKEEHIKEVADKWKGQISEKIYKAMYAYKVEITD